LNSCSNAERHHARIDNKSIWLVVQTAKKNIAFNRLEGQVVAIQGNAENFVDLSSDLVISNIHYDLGKAV
jgi:16S rRNA G1207 methylase RsmC